jgi:hypothetical protein
MVKIRKTLLVTRDELPKICLLIDFLPGIVNYQDQGLAKNQ